MSPQRRRTTVDDPAALRAGSGEADETGAGGHDELLREFVQELLAAGREARFLARGHSMHPAVRDGDAVVVAPLGERPPARGEILLALVDLPGGERGLLLHRLERILPDGRLLVRGDAVPAADPPLPGERILGRLVALERGGRTLRADGPLGRWLLRTGAPVPRALRALSRARARLAGGPRVPEVPLPPVRRLRARWLLRLALGDVGMLGEGDEPGGRLRLAPEERDLAPLLFFRLREEELDPEAVFDEEAVRAEIEALCRSAETEAACAWLAGTLHGAGLSACLTKGAALAWEVYPAPQTRPAADIDLLVRPGEVRAAVDACLAHGAALAEPEYTLSHYLRFGNEVALRLPAPAWPVAEIHWRGGGGGGAPASDPGRFREGAAPGRFGPGLLRMRPEAHFVYIVQHLAKHFPALRLPWAMDLRLLAGRIGDWDAVADWLAAERLELEAAAAIHWLDGLLPGTVPDQVQRRMLDGARRAGGLRRLRLGRSGGAFPRLAAAWAHDDLATRMAHLRHLLLPPRRTLERIFPGRCRSGILLQGLRVARLLRFRRR